MATSPSLAINSAVDLHSLLRSATSPAHERLEALPFFRALRAGTLPRHSIVSFLRSLAILHAVLERELTGTSNSRVAALSALAPPKLRLLTDDLDTLGHDTTPSIGGAIEAALECGADILAGASDPLSLIGPLYVLEGSQAGGIMLKQAYVRCLGLPPEQLTYVGCYGKATARHWKAFTDTLNALALSADEAAVVADSAVRCFEAVERICAALYPYDEAHLTHRVAAINPEAGDHAMPQDPREIALALRAGMSAWIQYPYLQARFGDRGRRFTRSDSCWLVSLVHAQAGTVTKSLEWLRTVLASRGIPTMILESHLRTISRALVSEFPDALDLATRYAPFLAAREREDAAGAETVTRLVRESEGRLRQGGGRTVESAAALIASAWRDERTGIPGALQATLGWFIDPDRFSAEWIAEVHALVGALEQSAAAPC